jgi:hypothetical protein
MLIKRVNIYDPIEENYKLGDIRVFGSTILAIAPHLNEQEAEPWIDLSGYFAYPSFIESHCHLIGTGKKLIEPHLDNIDSQDELKAILKSVDTDIVCLRGWSPHASTFKPSRSLLDQWEPHRPVLLIGKCGHIGYVNSKAIVYFSLEACDLRDGTDLNTGIIKERVLDQARACISFEKQQLTEYLVHATQLCKEYGISSAHSDDWNTSSAAHLLSVLDEQSDLRIYEHINLSPPVLYSDYMNKETIAPFFRNTPLLSISSFKFMLDGSFGGRSAYLNSPYADNPLNRGVLYYDAKELQSILIKAQECSWSTAFHIIGDGALEVFLSTFKALAPEYQHLKHRLIHVQMASSEQLDLIKQLDLYVSIQTLFYEADKEMAEKCLGTIRFRALAYPFKAMVEGKLNLTLSTDSPIEDINPISNMLTAEAFMSRKKAFYYYTVAGAKSIKMEHLQGTISVGSYADMLFLKEDLFTLPSCQLKTIKPDLVMFNGKWFSDSRKQVSESEEYNS